MNYDLHLGDSLEELRKLPSESVDLILCDLPYGTTKNKWDSVLSLPELWVEYRRVRRPGAATVLTCSQPFTSQLGSSNLSELKYAWVWEKSSVTGHLNAHHMPMKKHEDILVFYTHNSTYNAQGLTSYGKVKKRGSNGRNFGVSGTENFQESTNYPRSILPFPNDGKLHPTQKPVALMEYPVRTYTNAGAVVLDNTMGSGTTGVACMNAGRRFIGIERDEAYFEIARTRIESADCV